MASGFSTTGEGAELTREQVFALLIQPLLASSVVLASGVRIFDSQGGVPVRLPKLATFPLGTDPETSSASYWVGENEQIPETDPTFGEVVLLPSSLKSVKVLHRFSSELARHSVIDIANALQAALVRRVALALDAAFIGGDGANDTVTGVLNSTGIQTHDTTGGVDLDDILDAVGLLLDANASPSVWWLNPAEFIALRKQKDLQGRYLIQPDPTADAAYSLAGIRVLVSTQVPAGTLVLADASQIAVGRDLDASVRLLTERYADFDQLALRVVARMDLALLNPEAVCVLAAA